MDEWMEGRKMDGWVKDGWMGGQTEEDKNG